MEGLTVLITGGTGSFGQEFVKRILPLNPHKIIILSRDEFKQYHMKRRFNDDRIRFFLGDVRDKDRLYRAFDGVDIVVHAAAYKQAPILEYNSNEAVKTNIIGTMNVTEAAIDRKVKKVILISSDKATNATNIYGATKFAAERIFIGANSYGPETAFVCVRYGNVLGSRGSVVPIFQELARQNKPITVTDERMTRFWITYDKATELVLMAMGGIGGEILIPSMKIVDMARAIAPDSEIVFTGIRPGGEKIHETLVSTNEARNLKRFGDYYVIIPECHQKPGLEKYTENTPITDYTSNGNHEWLSKEQLKLLLKE